MRRFLKAPILIILISVLLIFLIFIFVPQKFELKSPNGGEQWRAGLTYSITWKARKIGEIDLYLVKEGTKEKIRIGEKISAAKKKFDWKINPWQEPREDYKIYIVESKTEKILDFSKRQFTILGPKTSDCYQAGLNDPLKRIFIPSDYPGRRRIFLTNGVFAGNIGNLQKADEICQKEAQSMGLEGNWKAILGDETTPITTKIENFEGMILEAPGTLTVFEEYHPSVFWRRFGEFINKAKVTPQMKKEAQQAYSALQTPFSKFLERINIAKTNRRCHRFLAFNFNEFLNLLTTLSVSELEKKWGSDFVDKLKTGVWWGIYQPQELKECINVPELNYYSLTKTCGNWTLARNYLEGFLPGKPEQEQKISIRFCYAPTGEKIMAGAIGGRALLLKGEFFTFEEAAPCNKGLRLLCIEEEPLY